MLRLVSMPTVEGLSIRYSSSGCAISENLLCRTEEPAKTGTCARDRRALQQLATNVHVKHFDLT